MKPTDIGLAVMVAVIWGLGFIGSRIALNEFSAASSIVFGERFGPLRLSGMLIVILFGSSLRPLMASARRVRAFNIVMARLLLASLYPVFTDA